MGRRGGGEEWGGERRHTNEEEQKEGSIRVDKTHVMGYDERPHGYDRDGGDSGCAATRVWRGGWSVGREGWG